MKDFDPVKPGQNNKSPPPPPRKSDSQGPSKRNWDPNIAENYPDGKIELFVLRFNGVMYVFFWFFFSDCFLALYKFGV